MLIRASAEASCWTVHRECLSAVDAVKSMTFDADAGVVSFRWVVAMR